MTDHFALNLGVRWDLQTFTTAGLISNPLFPPAGKVPYQPYNFAPRAGFAYSIGNTHPLVLRGGYGIFYVRIPQIYNSAIATENGVTDAQVFLNNTRCFDRYMNCNELLPPIFPIYPNPLVSCPIDGANCTLPAALAQGVPNDPSAVTHEVSAFAPNFVTPRCSRRALRWKRRSWGGRRCRSRCSMCGENI